MRRYVDRQLGAQRKLGHLEHVDDGLIGLAMTLADTMDAEAASDEPNHFVIGTLAARLLPVLMELRGERRDPVADEIDSELQILVAALRDAPRSRSADDWPPDTGAPGPPA